MRFVHIEILTFSSLYVLHIITYWLLMNTRTGVERLVRPYSRTPIQTLGEGEWSVRKGGEWNPRYAPCVCRGVKQRLLEK